MKPEKKADPDEYGRHVDEPIHWIVCQGGVLKEVKAEHTLGVSEILRVEDDSHNVDQKQHISGTNYAKPECESLPKLRKRTDTVVKHFICETCGKSFTCSSWLTQHERTHTGEKPYTCGTCGKSFAQFNGRKIHERTHTGEKPYTCETCGKSFNKLNGLREHERTHTGEKPYTCGTCGKSFATSSNLGVHEKTHTGVKPYNNNNNGRNGSCLTWLATSLEEKRRWLVINASPRGQYSK